MKQIPLTQGKFALVDDDVYEAIGHLKWSAKKKTNTFYACRGRMPMIRMHHCVIGYPLNGLKVDHKDGNGLNNQRDNLQIVTQRQNTQNRKEHRKGKLVGPYFFKNSTRVKPWYARITIKGKTKSLGYYSTEQEANEVYLEACEREGLC